MKQTKLPARTGDVPLKSTAVPVAVFAAVLVVGHGALGRVAPLCAFGRVLDNSALIDRDPQKYRC